MTETHQLALFWPQIFGLFAIVANIGLGLSIERDPKAQLPLTVTAVAITALAVSILFQAPRHFPVASSSRPNAVLYPSLNPPARTLPAALQYRQL